jgi:protein-S-isoprenylcysteine O-methyltransferase Ste14
MPACTTQFIWTPFTDVPGRDGVEQYHRMVNSLIESFLRDPWFWAFLAAIGWTFGFALIMSETFGRRPAFGVLCFLLAQVPRVVLALPFVQQPRLPVPWWTAVLGAAILLVTLPFTLAVLRIVPWTAPNAAEPLRTNGWYGVVRHPLMFRDSFWSLGWSLIFGSIIGVALTPVWLAICWMMAVVEEERLVSVYGDSYRRYQRTTSRLNPFLRYRRG